MCEFQYVNLERDMEKKGEHMVSLKNTMRSGSRFEDELVRMILRYTPTLWRNIRIETLLTQNGTTEMDILFCYRDMVFIIEAKNVSSVFGGYYDSTWSFVGASTPYKESRTYTKLNVITQNNIHARSFKDLFYAYFQTWPVVVPAIVVPNNCKVDADLSPAVFTSEDLELALGHIGRDQAEGTVQRRVASIISGDGVTVMRPDFVTDRRTGARYIGKKI